MYIFDLFYFQFIVLYIEYIFRIFRTYFRAVFGRIYISNLYVVLMSCTDVTEFSRQNHWTAKRSCLSPFIVYAACAYFEKVWGVWRKGWESVGDGCGEVWGRCREVCGGDGTCGKMWDI